MRLLKTGSAAPDFTAPLSGGDEFRLGKYRGRRPVVIFFYPGDFTPGCTAQVCSFRDGYEAVRAADAVLLGVSRDDDGSHESFIRRHALPFPLVADEDGRIARLYGVDRLPGILPLPRRVTYVIDIRGIIAGVVHREVRMRKHVEEVLGILKVAADSSEV